MNTPPDAPAPTAPAPTSLKDRIRIDIEELIMSGEWQPGTRIPYEHELMLKYDCSRMTVNKALAFLVERGLLERRKRAGTFVAIPTVHKALIDFPDMRTEVTELGRHYDFDLIRRIEREATAADRSHLAIAAGPVLQLDCLHFADGTPYAYETRIINLALVEEARTARFDREPPGCWLFEHVRWSDARHRISAINADAAIGGLLAVRREQACLQIERWTWRDTGRITYVKQIHAGETYALRAEFRN